MIIPLTSSRDIRSRRGGADSCKREGGRVAQTALSCQGGFPCPAHFRHDILVPTLLRGNAGLRRSASLPVSQGAGRVSVASTRSVGTCVPTQSVGTRKRGRGPLDKMCYLSHKP